MQKSAYNNNNKTARTSQRCVPERIFFYKRICKKMELKKPTSFDAQLQKIEERGCIIEDRKTAIDVLKQINYYRLTAYFLPFRKPDKNYIAGTSFNRVMRIYEFDRQLRYIIFPIIEEIEILLRTELSYYFSHKYGESGYYDIENFNNKHNHEKFIQSIDTSIENNKNQLFVKHHIEKYNSKFPFWVLIELFTFGELSRFYADMHRCDRKAFSKNVFNIPDKALESWLYCLTRLRNSCAHYTRLYYSRISPIPYTTSDIGFNLSNTVFDYLIILKKLFPSADKWNNKILVDLENLIEEYEEDICLNHIGFKENWKTIFKK